MTDDKHDAFRQGALDYHEFPKPGKLEIRAIKPLANGRDLARAYSPGVAEACVEIKRDPAEVSATPRAAIWWLLCQTAPPCSVLAISVLWPPNR